MSKINEQMSKGSIDGKIEKSDLENNPDYVLKYVPKEPGMSNSCLEGLKVDTFKSNLKHVSKELETPEFRRAMSELQNMLDMLDPQSNKPNPWERDPSLSELKYVPEEPGISNSCLDELKVDMFKSNLKYVPEESGTVEFRRATIKLHEALERVRAELKTEEMCINAITQIPSVFELVPNEFKTTEFYMAAVNKDGILLSKIPNEIKQDHPEICVAAVAQNKNANCFVPSDMLTPEFNLAVEYQHKKLETEKSKVKEATVEMEL